MANISRTLTPEQMKLGEDYNLIAKGFYTNPEAVDYTAISALAGAMGFRYIRVRLQPDWPMGQRFESAHLAAQKAGISLPQIQWQGGKNDPCHPDNVASAAVAEAAAPVVAESTPTPAPKKAKAKKAPEPIGAGPLRSFADLAARLGMVGEGLMATA